MQNYKRASLNLKLCSYLEKWTK